MAIALSDETNHKIIGSLKRYFKEQRDERK
jgi:hypothetical protein